MPENKAKKKYVIPIEFTMYGYYEIEAESIVDALDQAFAVDMPLPDDSEYLDNSLSTDMENLLELNPKLSEDEKEAAETWIDETTRETYN